MQLSLNTRTKRENSNGRLVTNFTEETTILSQILFAIVFICTGLKKVYRTNSMGDLGTYKIVV